MIYILSNINDYYKNNIYLNNLISKNYFIKLKIFFYSNDIIVFINNNNNNIKSTKYIFTNINDYNNVYDKLKDNNNFYAFDFNDNFNDIFNNNKLYINNFNNYLKSNIYDIFNIKYDNFGFIIIRNVISEKTNLYWQECYNCIRKYYNNLIIIIDDNSNEEFIKNNIILENCNIIKSEYNGVGEILGYYYYYKYNFFKKAVIIHDSVFINKKINFNINENIKFIWHFSHEWDTKYQEINLLDKLLKCDENNLDENNLYENLLNFYDKQLWMGCFGIQSCISYNFLKVIFEKYKLYNLKDIIKTRNDRMNLERIFGLICTYENNNLIQNPSFYGKIHHYIHWGYTFDMYLIDKSNDNKLNDNKKLDKYDIIKVWSGR